MNLLAEAISMQLTAKSRLHIQKVARCVSKIASVSVTAVALTAGLVTAGCGGGTVGQRTERSVRVGIVTNDLHHLPYYVAREQGFFQDAGLDIEETSFGTGAELMSAFSAGKLDAAYVGIAPAVVFTGLGMADVLVVAQVNAEGSSIVVRNGLEAGGVEALAGQTIAVPGFSTVQDYVLRAGLARADVSADDVSIVVVNPDETADALTGGGADAACVAEPVPSEVVAGVAGRALERSSKIVPGHPCCVLVADSRFAEDEPGTVRRAVAAHADAVTYINENPVEAVDMAHLFTGLTREIVQPAMKNIDFVVVPDEKAIERYVRFLMSGGVLEAGDAGEFTRDLVDTGFLPEGGP